VDIISIENGIGFKFSHDGRTNGQTDGKLIYKVGCI
jgi:hypothetical protein